MEPSPQSFMDLLSTLLSVVSVLLGIISGVLAVIAIWLSLYFYKRSNELNLTTLNFLSRTESTIGKIEILTTQMEEASKRVTGRLLDGVLGQLPSPSRIDQTEEATVLQLAKKVGAVLGPQRTAEAEAIQKGIQEVVSNAFTAVKAQVGPTSIEYDWGPFVRRIDELERSHKFLGVGLLHKQVFGSEPDMKEALQFALKNGILEKEFVPNLPGQDRPVRACKLNRLNEIVLKALTT
jgi:hypothetical protein